MNDLKEQLARLDEQIDALPRGSISSKKVNGHTYYYHRWYEGKTKKEKFIPENELEQLRDQIEQRKELQAQREAMKKGDKVVTAGGIYGEIKEVQETTFIITIAKDVTIKVSKDSVFADATDAVQQQAEKK